MASQELIDRIAGRRVVASISGGKDSAAMSLWLTEQGIQHDRVFFNTGWEYRATYDYLRKDLVGKLGPITERQATIKVPERELDSILRAIAKFPMVKAEWDAENPMVRLLLVKGMFASRMMRFCTQELKWGPLKQYLGSYLDRGIDILNAVGVRAEESEARAKMPEWENVAELDCEVWRPMLQFTEQQVIDIHAAHGLRPNPLYLERARRVGCWPCINARKDEIRFIAEYDPERIELVRQLEGAIALRWADLREAGRRPNQASAPTWFSMKPSVRERLEFVPIDAVIAWSKTARGSAQVTMFPEDAPDAGCMRWGLCDTGSDTEQKS